jgi:hypothetical protein
MEIDEPGDDHQGDDEIYNTWEVRWAAEEEFQKTPVVEPFPSIKARVPIANIHAVLKYKLYKRDLVNLDNP